MYIKLGNTCPARFTHEYCNESMYALFFVSSNCKQHRNLVLENQILLKTEW
jgi:hypothetical protein